MDARQLEAYRHFHHALLCLDLLPYWERCGKDYEFGGFLNCMSDSGELISAEKFVWAQGSGLWAFSHVWSEGYDRHLRLREFLLKTRQFLLKHGRDGAGDWNYRMGRAGEPLEGPVSIFSDIFAVLGLVEFHRAMDDDEALEVAHRSALRIVERIRRPGFNTVAPHQMKPGQQRQDVSFRTLDCLTTLLGEVEDATLEEEAARLTGLLCERHADRQRKVNLELLGPGGELPEEAGARDFYPSHGIECARALLAESSRRNDKPLLADALEILRWHLEGGWDREHGGVFWALDVDCAGAPREPHWDRKRLAPHMLALQALMLAHEATGEAWTADWYGRVHDYAFATFRNPEHGDFSRQAARDGRRLEEPPSAVKDPFPALRAVMGVMESIDRQLGAAGAAGV